MPKGSRQNKKIKHLVCITSLIMALEFIGRIRQLSIVSTIPSIQFKRSEQMTKMITAVALFRIGLFHGPRRKAFDNETLQENANDDQGQNRS